MEFNTQESIIVNNKITEVGKAIKELIIEIKGEIILDQSKYFLWTYKYGIQTIECQTFLIKKQNTTEITTIAESDDAFQKGARFIIKKLYTELLQNNQIKPTEPYIQKRIHSKVKSKHQENKSDFKPYLLYFLLGVLIVMFVVYQSNKNTDTIPQQEITNSTLEDSDYNNPNTSESLQSNIGADDEIKLRQFKDKVQILFDQLMIFKNENYFQEVGFAECCKYNKWLKNVEALIGTHEAELFINQEHYYHINDLVQLGRDYIHLEGRESEYTKWNKKRLIEALKEK